MIERFRPPCFRARFGRVYHQEVVKHEDTGAVTAECGARFLVTGVGFVAGIDKPTCPKCRRVLAERAALVAIAAALMSEYGE